MKKYVLFIGIDMSKLWFDMSISRDGIKDNMLHQQYKNTLKGYKKALQWLAKQSRSMSLDGPWLFCLEHTGVYTLPLCVFLEQHQHDFILESALRVQRSIGIRRAKSDKADSKDIAMYAHDHHKKLILSNLPAKELMQIKNLLAHRARLVKQKTALKSANGQYTGYMPKGFKIERIEQDNKELIKLLSQKIRDTDREIKQIIKQHDELKRLYDLARSVIGVGPVIAATLLVFTNQFKAFDDARKFASYIGIAPFGRSSGTSLNIKPKVSKLGHSKIKALIGNGVNSAIQHDRQIKAYYDRKIEEGKNKYKVLNAIKNKLISRVFATIKRGTPYVELSTYG